MRDGWFESKLGEICEIYQPKTIAKSLMTESGKYVVYGANGPIGRFDEYNHEDSEVVVTCRGATCGTVNKTPKKTWITGNAMVVKPKNDSLLKDFLFLSLTSYVDLESCISGSAQPQITREGLSPQKILISPLAEQKRIVDLISSVDSYIEALQQQVDKARKSRNAVLHELLTKGGDGWVETTLDKVSESSWGNTETTKSKYIKSGYLAYSATGADGFLDWYDHDGTAVVLSAIGAQCGKTWFAEGKWTSIKNTIWLKSDNLNLLDKYLFYLSNRPQFWQIRGQAQPFISLGDVKKTKVILPPIPEQKRIIEILSTIDDMVNDSERTLEESKNLRSGLLFDLLSGEREIPASYDKFIGAAR
jgi:restriction endonuclease S subunit